MRLLTTSHRATRRKGRWQVAAAIFLALLGAFSAIVSLQTLFTEQDFTRRAYATSDAANISSPGANCSRPQAISHYPADVFTQEQRRQGAVILHVIATLYMFLALAIICDDYFVPSLERISEALGLQPDVAGATFMAAGSSAPELFTSIFGVFVSRDDIGVGTVVGSAVFNLLFIVGLCGLLVGTAITLTLWPLLRDCSVFLISVAALVIVMYDGKIHWYEALTLVVLYCLYVVLMYFNPRLSAAFSSCCSRAAHQSENEETSLMKPVTEKDTDDEETVQEEPNYPFKAPSQLWRRVLWVIGLPLTTLLVGTVPDCRRDKWKRWYPVSFVMSVAWIGVFTYILVWMVTVIGEGDMAVSNAVGSNVFDILVGLGVPWFFKTVVIETNSVVPIQSGGLVYSAITLLSTVLILLFTMWLNRWRLDRKLGVICSCLYAVFITLATLYELNVFGDFNPPTCPG
ncbi:sodium/potassium/calcium exchanger 5-like isoform X2 [Branchiostoma floridae x Branchiostoma japonicum]